MKNILLTITSLFLVFMVSAKTIKSKGEPVVVGNVTDAVSKKPVAEVTVTAIHLTTKSEHQISTDINGNFKINQLPTGNYKIKFEKNNYKPVEKNNITIKQDSTSKINIEITEKEETTYESIIWDLRFGI